MPRKTTNVPGVRQQRRIESLLIEERVAYVYYEAGELDSSRQILLSLRRYIAKLALGHEDADLRASLVQLKRRIKGSLAVIAPDDQSPARVV